MYYCIRSGYLQEALQVVDASTDPSGRQTSIPFADALREWVRSTPHNNTNSHNDQDQREERAYRNNTLECL